MPDSALRFLEVLASDRARAWNAVGSTESSPLIFVMDDLGDKGFVVPGEPQLMGRISTGQSREVVATSAQGVDSKASGQTQQRLAVGVIDWFESICVSVPEILRTISACGDVESQTFGGKDERDVRVTATGQKHAFHAGNALARRGGIPGSRAKDAYTLSLTPKTGSTAIRFTPKQA